MFDQYAYLLRRVEFLELHPPGGFELGFQTARGAYPFPHTFIGNHRCVAGKIKLGEFRYPLRSPPGRQLRFFIFHMFFDI